MRSIAKILLICAALASPLAAGAVQAAGQPIVIAQGSGMTLDQAVEQVRRQYKDGRIISAETRVVNGREVHYVRVMVDGKVKTVKVNGRQVG